MRKPAILAFFLLCAAFASSAAAATHAISFGPKMQVKLFLGPVESRTVPLAVRTLIVDGKVREFTTGDAHDVTDRLFVVRRAFRINNNLPSDEKKVPNWMWQLGGWLMVDRLTGHVSQVPLAEFDPFYSSATWFRDYAAYCGINENTEKLYAIVVQLGSKKPILRREIGKASQGDDPGDNCAPPTWEKKPTRVTFAPKQGEKITVQVFGHSADLAPASDEE